MKIMFWVMLSVLLYMYIGYPLLLIILSGLLKREKTNQVESRISDNLPIVSLIIAAYNEEEVIEEKVKNSLALDYPSELFEIVIVSDGSDDSTNGIVNRLAERYDLINFLSYPHRQGKAHALNQGVMHSKGDILVFSDANVMYDKKAIKEIISKFFDPPIGGVCGKVLLYSSISQEVQGEGLYMRYERFIHKCESRIKTMIGTDGAMYAIRRELYSPLPSLAIIDDFIIAMRVAGQGYRVIYADNALAYEESASSVENEFKRKVRIFAGGYQATLILRSILNPFKNPFVVFGFFSHKLLRWLSPFFVFGMLLSNLILLNNLFYICTFVFQGFFYGLALFGYLYPKNRTISVVYFPLYFSIINIAALFGFFRFIFGLQRVTWERARD